MAQVSSDTGKADVVASEPSKKLVAGLWFSQRWVDVGIGIVLFGVAMVLNLRHLGTPSIWFDEAFSVELARQPLPLLWHIIFGLEPNMELYYLFLHFWLMLTGAIGLLPTEAVVRFPSTIFAALSTVSVFYIGRRFITAVAGVLAAGLYLLNYLQLVYAQQTRSYSLQLLCICLAWYALLMALSRAPNARRWWRGGQSSRDGGGWVAEWGPLWSSVRANKKREAPLLSATTDDHTGPHLPSHPTPVPTVEGVQKSGSYLWWVGYVIATTLAVYSHLFTFLILFSQLVAVTGILLLPSQWRTTARAQLRSYIGSLFAIGVLIIPMLLVSREGAKTGWLPIPHWHEVSYLFETISGYSKTYLLVIAVCSGAGVLLVTLAYALFSMRRNGKNVGYKRNEVETASQLFPLMFALLCWFAIPIVVSYVVSHGSLRLFSTRYLVTIVPPLCLLMGLGVSMLRLPAPRMQEKPILFFGNGGRPQGSPPFPSSTPVPTGKRGISTGNGGRPQGSPPLSSSPPVPTEERGSSTVGTGVGRDRRWGPLWSSVRLASLSRHVPQGILGLVLLALAFPSVSQYYRSAQVEDWNTVSHWIMQQYQPGDGLVCYDNDVQQGCQISIQYYFDAYPSAAHFTADTPGAFSWTNFASARADAAVDPTVLAAYGAKHPRILFIVGRLPDDRAAAKAQAAQQWLDSHYHLLSKFEKTTVTVRLYVTQ